MEGIGKNNPIGSENSVLFDNEPPNTLNALEEKTDSCGQGVLKRPRSNSNQFSTSNDEEIDSSMFSAPDDSFLFSTELLEAFIDFGLESRPESRDLPPTDEIWNDYTSWLNNWCQEHVATVLRFSPYKFERVKTGLESLLAINPNFVIAHFLMGKICFTQYLFKKIEFKEEEQETLIDSKNNLEKYLNKVAQCEDKESPFLNSLNSYYYLSQIYAELGKFDQANTACSMMEEAIKKKGDVSSPYSKKLELLKGVILRKQKKWTESERILLALENNIEPEERELAIGAANALGLTLSEAGQMDRAKEYFYKVLSLDPENSIAYQNYHGTMQKFDTTAKDKKYRKDDEENLVAVEKSRQTFLQKSTFVAMEFDLRKEYETGVSVYEIILKVDRNNALANRKIALFHAKKGNTEYALQHVIRCEIERQQDEEDNAYLSRVLEIIHVYYLCKNYDESCRISKKLYESKTVEAYPDFYLSLILLHGYSLIDKGNNVEACDVFLKGKRKLSVFTNSYLSGLFLVYSNLKDFPSARRQFQEIQQKEPTNLLITKYLNSIDTILSLTKSKQGKRQKTE